MSEHIRTRLEEGVLTVTLDRPDKKNAITRDMYRAMTGALEHASRDDLVRVVLLTGTGDSFSAGNDIGDFQRTGAPGEEASPTTVFTDRIAEFDKPLIAAVNGLAVGIGTTMLLHCDLVYASEDARFRLPFVDLGLVTELGSSLLLPRLAGHHRAAELLLLGRFFTAEEARDIGVVNRVLPRAELVAYAADAARSIAAKPVQALRQIRALLKGDLEPVLARKRREAEMFAERLRSPEAQAIFAAFMQRGSARSSDDRS